jgi:hypothetical protein
MLGGEECDCDGKCGERVKDPPLSKELSDLAKILEEKAK